MTVQRRSTRPPHDPLVGVVSAAVDRLVDDGAESALAATRPHLARAVVAQRLAESAARLARLEVAAARELDDATWQNVGDAFGIIRQSAHERFGSGPDGPATRPSRASSRQSTSTLLTTDSEVS